MRELRGSENQIKKAEIRLTKMNETIIEIMKQAIQQENNITIETLNNFQQKLQKFETATAIINLFSMIDIYIYALDADYRKDFGNYFLDNCGK